MGFNSGFKGLMRKCLPSRHLQLNLMLILNELLELYALQVVYLNNLQCSR